MRVRGEERGAALVEFALILPILVMFVFGIIEFGREYSARIQLTSAVREGARAAALGFDPVAATIAAAPGLKLTAANVVYTPSPGSTCTGASSTTTTTSVSTTTTTIPTARVTANYAFAYQIPLVRSGTMTLSATGVFQCGG
jgi:Flp pilus assembly protein TadG